MPPLATERSVPDQSALSIVFCVESEPKPRLVRAVAASLAPVPPSAIARSVIPVMLPPVMLTLLEACVDKVPRPRLVRAPEAVVAPVPPLSRSSVPASVSVPLVVTGPPEKVRPVVPPLASTDVTVPVVAVSARTLTVPDAFLKYSFSSVVLMANSPSERSPADGVELAVDDR